ncbi:hypothetical protein [Paenibacillus sp. FSL M7-1046]|uniref:hypothetical protein n=1 Tax=Paenibacillus sp. FSL M7-1046 TaxID=2975315 RepID=UPI0030F9E4CA
MALTESVLLFDKNEISVEQVIERVKHYVDLAEKGMKLLESNKSAALACLKEIRSTMAEEYKYYYRSKVEPFIIENHLYNTYRSFIDDAFAKQNSPNSYDTLNSNLYDVMDYGRYYFSRYLSEK